MRRNSRGSAVFSSFAALLTLACGARTTLRANADETALPQTTNGSSTNGSSTNGSSTNGSSTNGSSTNGSSTGAEQPQRKLDKLDILLSVDDSVSMADKQRLLKAAVPDLIGRLANPFCVDADRRAFPELTPAAGDPCPEGPRGQLLEREFLPVSDVHVGLVTSTLGEA